MYDSWCIRGNTSLDRLRSVEPRYTGTRTLALVGLMTLLVMARWILGGVGLASTVPVWFVGLSSISHDGNPIERLTAKIERYQAGADVDFSTDRDDEIGALYDAVAGMADQGSGERERELREANERLNAIIDSSPNAMMALDADGTVELWNPASERLFGWTEDEAVGEALPIVPDDYADEHETLREQVLVGEAVEGVDTKRRTKDGDLIDVSLSAAPIRGDDGEVVGFVAILDDITERKKREAKLQETRDTLTEHNQTLRRLYELSAEKELSFDEKVEKILALGRERFGTAGSFVSKIDEAAGRFEFTHAGGTIEPISPGTVAPYSETYCRRLVDIGEVFELTDATKAGWLGDPAYKRWGLESYFGACITVDGELEGTLAFVDETPAESMTDSQRTFLSLAAQWVGYELERRQRERDLAEYQEFTNDILDAVDDVFYILDDDGHLERWNDSLRTVTGYSDAEIGEMRGTDFFAEEHTDDIAAAISEVFETGQTVVEAPFRTKDGDSIPHEFIATLVQDPDGEPKLAGIGRDVTDRQRRERELLARSAALDGANDGIAILDQEREYTYANPAKAEIHGYDDPEAFLGASSEMCYDADTLDRVEREALPVIEDEGSWRGEISGKRADGTTFPQEVSLSMLEDGRIVSVVRDITERKERTQELERTRSLLEQSQRMADVGAWEITIEDGEPTGIHLTEEAYRIHDRDPESDTTLEDMFEELHPEDIGAVREGFQRAITEAEPYDLEVRLGTQAERTRWARVIAEPVTEAGAVTAIRGSVQDITDRKEREFALQTLHETTRGLLGTATDDDVVDRIVEAASAVLDGVAVGVYLLSYDSNQLRRIGATDEFASLCDGTSGVDASDESLLWECFASNTPREIERPGSRDGTPFSSDCRTGLVRPMGDHGVFAVATASSQLDDETRWLVDMLVAMTEAALDRVESEDSLREHKAELEDRNERLERQIRITDIIRQIDRSLIGAESPEEIERSVCQRLVEDESIGLAWIGTLEPGEDRLTPRSWAGSGDSYLDTVTGAGFGSGEPAWATAESDAPTVVGSVVERLQDAEWPRHALEHDFNSIIAVPLTFDEYSYGVLAVYATDPDTFGELEESVFAELGESIANSITAAKTRQALHAETHIELRFRFTDTDDLLARVARAVGCTVEYEGLSTHAADETSVFFRTPGTDPEAVRAVLDERVSVSDHRLITAGDETPLFEVTTAGPVVAAKLVRHGGRPRTITATPEDVEVVVDMPTGTDVREFVDMLRDTHPSVELVAQRHVERATRTKAELVSTLLGDLTERQREVLETAYHAGFFESPRDSTGEDIAEILEVSQPTVNRHLRLAQRRLLSQLFEESVPTRRS